MTAPRMRMRGLARTAVMIVRACHMMRAIGARLVIGRERRMMIRPAVIMPHLAVANLGAMTNMIMTSVILTSMSRMHLGHERERHGKAHERSHCLTQCPPSQRCP